MKRKWIMNALRDCEAVGLFPIFLARDTWFCYENMSKGTKFQDYCLWPCDGFLEETGHPISCLALSFTTRWVNSSRQPSVYCLGPTSVSSFLSWAVWSWARLLSSSPSPWETRDIECGENPKGNKVIQWFLCLSHIEMADLAARAVGMLEGWPCTRESTSELNRESLNFQHSLCLDNVTQRSNRQAQRSLVFHYFLDSPL